MYRIPIRDMRVNVQDDIRYDITVKHHVCQDNTRKYRNGQLHFKAGVFYRMTQQGMSSAKLWDLFFSRGDDSFEVLCEAFVGIWKNKCSCVMYFKTVPGFLVNLTNIWNDIWNYNVVWMVARRKLQKMFSVFDIW